MNPGLSGSGLRLARVKGTESGEKREDVSHPSAATPRLPTYTPEGSLNRFSRALGKDMLTAGFTNEAKISSAIAGRLPPRLNSNHPGESPPTSTLANWRKPKPQGRPITHGNTERACALASHRIQLGSLYIEVASQ